MRLQRSQPLARRLFLRYGLISLALILIVGLGLFFVLSNWVNRNIRSSLEKTNRSIVEIIENGARIEIRRLLQAEVSAAMDRIARMRSEAREAGAGEQQIRQMVIDMLAAEHIGREGYFFIIHGSGKVIYHPREELVGEEVRNLDFIQAMKEQRRGFMEYESRLPGEEQVREKALVSDVITDWDWIIAASVYWTDYPRLFDINSLDDFIQSIDLGDRGYSFVVNGEGTLLVHPTLRGRSLPETDTPLLSIMRRGAKTSSSGFIPYSWHPDGRDRWEKKLLHYIQLKEFDWYVASTVYLTDVQRPLWRLGIFIFLFSILTLIIFLIVSSRFGRILSRPLDSINECLDKGEAGDYSRRVAPVGVKELDALAEHFNRFMEQLEQGKEVAMSLETLRALSDTVFQNTIEGIAITDLEGTIQQINQAFTEITGYTMDEVLGKNPRMLKSDRHERDFYEYMWRSINETGRWSGEIWNRRKSGEAYPEWLSITTLRGNSNEPVGYISIFHDISRQKKTEQRLSYQAYHDALTGLPNRSLFRDRLEMAIASANRTGEKGAVIFMDIDNFKQVNDVLGHIQGDQFLSILAERLVRSIREVDTVARLGGDEFSLLLPVLQEQSDAIEVLTRIIDRIEEPVLLGTKTIHPRASFGITYFPEDGNDSDRLMRNADMAMYRSKHRGDGGYTLFNANIEKKNLRRTSLEDKLRGAVTAGHFLVYYQPQYSLEQKRVTGFEALIRWNDPQEGWISPGEFIPIAESSGLISAIDTWTLRQALGTINTLNRETGKQYTISANVSALQFREEGFVESILAALNATSFPPELLELEITESTAMQNVSAAIAKIEELSKRGVCFAVDDFGTGYSSLSYLNRLKADTLKIDSSFIQELDTVPEAAAVVTSVIALGKNLGMRIIAEGVETEAQLEFIQKHSCSIIQGYLFGRPMPFEELKEFLKHEA